MRLHRDMGIQMIERAICLLTPLPSTLVHALNLFIAPARSLMLLGAGDRDERINLGKRMRILLGTRLSTGGKKKRKGRGKNVLVRVVVLHWRACQARHCRGSCRVHRASHGDVPRTAAANVEGSLGEGGPDNDSSREAVAHTANREDR